MTFIHTTGHRQIKTKPPKSQPPSLRERCRVVATSDSSRTPPHRGAEVLTVSRGSDTFRPEKHDLDTGSLSYIQVIPGRQLTGTPGPEAPCRNLQSFTVGEATTESLLLFPALPRRRVGGPDETQPANGEGQRRHSRRRRHSPTAAPPYGQRRRRRRAARTPPVKAMATEGHGSVLRDLSERGPLTSMTPPAPLRSDLVSRPPCVPKTDQNTGLWSSQGVGWSGRGTSGRVENPIPFTLDH